jgi:hypothetical protein
MAGDDPHAVQAAEVAVDESVPGLGAVVRALGEPEVPRGILVPRVPGQVGVLVLGGGLRPASLAAEHVLASVDQLPRVGDPGLVHPVLRHRHPPADGQFSIGRSVLSTASSAAGGVEGEVTGVGSPADTGDRAGGR